MRFLFSLRSCIIFTTQSYAAQRMTTIIFRCQSHKHKAWAEHTITGYFIETVTMHWLNISPQLCCITSCNRIHWKKRLADAVKIALIWIFPPVSFLWRTFDILITTIRKPTGNRDTAAELWMGCIDLFCGSGTEIKVWIQYYNIRLALRCFLQRAALLYSIFE